MIHRVRWVKEVLYCPDCELSAENYFAGVCFPQHLPGAGGASTSVVKVPSPLGCFWHVSSIISLFTFLPALHYTCLNTHWKHRLPFNEPNRCKTKLSWIINRQYFVSLMKDPSTSKEASLHLSYLWPMWLRPLASAPPSWVTASLRKGQGGKRLTEPLHGHSTHWHRVLMCKETACPGVCLQGLSLPVQDVQTLSGLWLPWD